MSRREIREHICKLLFLLEFYNGDELNEQAERYLDEVEGAVPTEEEAAYIRERFHKIEAQITELDQILTGAATGWKPSRMSKVDLAILRLAVYEILYADDIPNKVSANEAVELAKLFSSDKSPSFINGVLGKVISNI